MESCLHKQSSLWKIFQPCLTPEAKYEKLINLGISLPPLPAEYKVKENLVHGCQSKTYLTAELKDGFIYFMADSDALISKGLAALLIQIYNEEPPQALFLCPPTILQKLDILPLLSPLRSNGLKAIYKKMQEAAANKIS